jgi:hypothetical protein
MFNRERQSALKLMEDISTGRKVARFFVMIRELGKRERNVLSHSLTKD